MQHSFLNNIADAYASDPDLRTYTFVFPNLRSKRYFTKCLKDRGIDKDHAKQLCITLTQFTEGGSGLQRATSLSLIFLLYKAYCQVCEELKVTPQEFDRFRFWGQRILQDFDDVDNYMASSKEVFANTRDFNKIQALYLNEAQKEIIERYWGDDPYWKGLAAGAKAEEFPLWNHITPEGETAKTYAQLWAILQPLYEKFHSLLQGKCYPGMAAKTLALKLMHGQPIETFGSRLFVFIGFNRLTTAETIIFEKLQKQGRAHFYWDYDPQLMGHLGGNPAGRFISKYVDRFTEGKDDVVPPQRPAQHQVDVVGVPSVTGQAKVMAQMLDADSAVVLPDEEMLLPVMESIPESFSKINVTMGYPMRFSALSQLFAQLVSLQLRTIKDAAGQTLLYREDVRAIITNPLVQAAFNEECRWLDAYMRSQSLFNLPASRLSLPEFGPLATLLRPLGDNPTIDQMAQYLQDVIALAQNSKLLNQIDKKCAAAIADMAKQIVELIKECNVSLNKHTFFNLIERMLFQRSMPLESEDFGALQVMGVLETRAMGFPDVVMLSMTDAIFPGRDNSASFIPESLRYGYGLPTADHFEVDAAYHFYHILSAARHLTLIYDSRTGGLTSGEMSRYIHQLRHLNFPGVKVNMHVAEFESRLVAKQNVLIDRAMELPKTPRAMEKLNQYRTPGLFKTNYLSASALKEYIHCPMEFYFNRVERICPYDVDSESLNAAEYGSVVHEVADRVYTFLQGQNGGMITAEMLDTLLDGGYDNKLDNELTRAINLCRNHFPAKVDGKENPDLFTAKIVGEAAVYRVNFEKALRRLFAIDRQTVPFEVVGTEVNETLAWPIDPATGLSVNFTMKIDRIDRITDADGNSILRVADYKTGNDQTSYKSIDDLFDFNNPDFPQAIFQLFTYCAAYLHNHPEIDPQRFRPQIFTLKDPSITQYPLITKGNVPITDYAMVMDEFMPKLRELLAGLFDQSQPFRRAQSDKACRFCKVYSLCHEESKYRDYKR